jgi:Fe-S-cluster containining protein
MSEQHPWYQDGLRFKCTQCGNCCTGFPGYVWVSKEEIQAIAKRFGVDEATVRVEYTRTVGRRVTLLEVGRNHDCVFFDPAARKCTIYEDRPTQCRTWPFWESNLESPEDWESIKSTCPGAGTGKLYSIEFIQAEADKVSV